MNGVQIAYHYSPTPWQESPVPFTWQYPIERDGMPEWSKEDIAYVVCAQGHRLRATSKVHHISEDGTVHPSWVCTVSGCTFHAFIQLVGWGKEPRP